MAREKIEAEVEFRPKGLAELKSKWANFAGDLLEPVVLLAAGATKAQAAWAGFRGIMESRVLGPLGMVAGMSVGFLATTRLLISRWRDLGMTAAGSLERMTLQFRPLLGSLERARERVQQLSRFAAETPFELPEVTEANKMLETLTQGALSTEKGMRLVGDAASVAGVAFSDMAQPIGRLYDGLMSGRPVGEAAMRLQELGIISGATRSQIESMQAANASGLEVWRVVEAQLERNRGAMGAQSRSLEGLQSTYADTKRSMEAGFSGGFLEGEKAGVEGGNKMMEALTPVMQTLGKEAGVVENRWETLKLAVVKSVTSWKGFGATVEWLIKGMVGLAAVMAGASVTAIAGFTINLLKLAAGNKAAAQSADYLSKVESAGIPVKTKLVSVKNALAAALRANAAGLRAEAGAQLGAAAAGAKNLAATNGFVGVVRVGGLALRGMGMAVGFVAAQLRAMAVALLSNPLVWVAALVIGAAMAFSKLAAVQKEARERLEGYQKSTKALDTGLGKQIADIRTMIDLRQAEAKVLTELTGAYREMEGARNGAEKKAAGDRVDMLKKRLKDLPATGDLRRPDDEMERGAAYREAERRQAESERDAIAAKGPEEAAKVAAERLREIITRRQEALGLAIEERATEERAAAARRNAVADEGKRQGLMERRARLEKEYLEYTQKAETNVSAKGSAAWRAKADAVKPALDAVDRELAAMAAAPVSAETGAMLGSGSELQRIRAKLAVLDQLKAATDALAAAESELENNTDTNKAAALKDQVAASREALAAAQALAGQAGVAGMTQRGRQSLEARRDELASRRMEDEDPGREAEAGKARRDAEAAVAQARVEAEQAVAGLRLRGYERELRLLDFEREKLDLRRAANQIGVEEYERQTKILAERRAAAERDAGERRTELTAAFTISVLRRREEEARRAGDPARAEEIRKQAEMEEDARTWREARREGLEVAATPQGAEDYANNKTKEAQRAREMDRKREEDERARGRAGAVADQAGGVAAIEAEILRRQGKTREAKNVREAAARKRDEVDRGAAEKRYRDQGFTATEASRMANKEVKLSQAERLMAELNGGGRGSVVASSLARIGGGGGVSGTDPDTRLMERMVRLLEQIRDDGRKDVGWDLPP